jgi:antitoxin component YwqK of YwqJK toxin-antitoxin module
MQDKNKTPHNEKTQPHGYWETYYSNGQLDRKGLWINGKRFGFHESYSNNGELSFRGNFINSELYGYWEDNWDVKISEEYYAR